MGGREYLCRTITLQQDLCRNITLQDWCSWLQHYGCPFWGLIGRGILSIDVTIVGVIVSTYTVATYSHLHDHASLSIYSHTN